MPAKLKSILNEFHPLRITDLLFYAAIILFCFFCFQHGDILHTSACSTTYLAGHFGDFYQMNERLYTVVNYMPSTYVLFALWGLPLKILGLLPEPGADMVPLRFWYKGLCAVLFFASGHMIRLIGHELGLSKKNSLLMGLFWITSPIAIFSTFVFGGYDVLTVFFTLAAFYLYLKDERVGSALIFGFASTFKYFPLFIFIPLLLLREKKLGNLVKYSMIFAIPLVINILPYITSPAFHTHVFGFAASDRLFSVKLDVGAFSSSFYVLFWLLWLCYSYLTEPKSREDFAKWAVYLAMVPPAVLFCLIQWHPQWVIFMTPFLCMASFLHRKHGFYFFLDIIQMYAFVMASSYAYPHNVDQNLWGFGILGSLNPVLGTIDSKTIVHSIFFRPKKIEFWFAAFSAVSIAYSIAMRPSAKGDAWVAPSDTASELKKRAFEWRGRLALGRMAWLVPATALYLYNYMKTH